MAKAIRGAEVQVEGLRELRRELRRLDTALPRALRAVNKDVAERIVVPAARRRAGLSRTDVAGHPTRLGSAGVTSIRALASQTSATVAMGGARVPWAAGHEWGSQRFRQFPPSSRAGYILYPTVREKQAEVVAAYQHAVDPLLQTAFPD